MSTVLIFWAFKNRFLGPNFIDLESVCLGFGIDYLYLINLIGCLDA